MQMPAAAQRVAAVLSSDLHAYDRAFKGFSAAVGEAVAVSVLGRKEVYLPRETQVVVAFGSKASLRTYPQDLAVVMCMAPAAQSRAPVPTHQVRVHMMPDAEQVMARLHQLQPDLRHLATLSILDISGGYLDSLGAAARRRGATVHHERLGAGAELPASLRRLTSLGVDALWLPPDPMLINAASFDILRQYAKANKVPFYVPTAGFVEAGAVASIAPSFEQVGAAAAAAARALLRGTTVAAEVFPAESETTVNLQAAQRTGLREGAVRRTADRLIEIAE